MLWAKKTAMQQEKDPRNDQLLIYVGDKLYLRNEAKISVFDSVVQGGDAVWEGLRLYKEGVFCLEQHLKRLENSAHAMQFEGVPDRQQVKNAIRETLQANNMTEDVHIRLTLTRGEKITSGMDPRLNKSGCTLIVLAEWKPPVYDNENGIRVITSAIRRNSPQFLDSKIHHNNLINNILAKIQANLAGVDDALMLDEHGFASELNGTNIFAIQDSGIYTPHSQNCLPGITRGLVLKLGKDLGIFTRKSNLSLTQLYCADALFATGTMGELTPIIELDGRKIPHAARHPVFNLIQNAFVASRNKLCARL